MRRAGLFFAFEKELDVRSERDAFIFQRSEGSQNRHHASFVVGRGARVDAPARIDSACISQSSDLSAFFDRTGSKDRFPRRCSGPLFGIGWLAVVVRVNEDGPLGAGSFPFAVNRGRRVWGRGFEQTRIQATLLHHLDDERGVPADVLVCRKRRSGSRAAW